MKNNLEKIKVMNIIVHLGAGGAQELLINYSRKYKKDKKFDYWIFVLEGPRNSKYDAIVKNENLKVKYLNAPSVAKAKTSVGFVMRKIIGSFYILKAMYNFKPDIIHTHITLLFESALLPLICFDSKKLFHTLHSDPETYKGIDLQLAKIAFNIKHIQPICINEKQMAAAKKRYHIKSANILYNSIDMENIQNNKLDKMLARKKYGISSNAFVLGAVGRISEVKNYMFLIDIFEKVYDRNEKAILLVLGAGNPEELQEIVRDKGLSEKVFFFGEIQNPIPIYCTFDAYINTSLHESCSLTTLEAQALNLKCFVSGAVPKESIFTSNVKRIDINNNADVWAKQICECKVFDKPCMKKDHYSISKNKHILEKIYLKAEC